MSPRARPRQRLLLVLDDCGPGDALAADFCLDAVRRAHRGAEIDLLVSERAAPVFARDRRFQRVITSRLYEQRARRRSVLVLLKMREAARLSRALRRRYDLTVTFYWGTTLLNVIARLLTRGPSLGYANAWPWLLDSRLGRYKPEGDPLEQAARLLAAAGLQATPALPAPRVEQGAAQETAGLLDLHGLKNSSELAVVHTGSDWACQQWLPERWAELADRLAAELGLDVVFTGVRAEAAYIEGIRQRMFSSSVSLAGDTRVPDLTVLLARAAICVCVDSLPFQLAQAAGTPTVLLAGQSRTEAAPLGAARPVVVNRTTPQLRAAILACKLSHERASYGGCLHYGCPMAGLRDISVEDVVHAVRGSLHRRVVAAAPGIRS